MKKYFLFSDVHGELDALLKSLGENGFSSENDEHILVNLGDSFDRGKQNDKLVEFLHIYLLKNRLVLIEGNHDVMLKNFLRSISSGRGRNENLWNVINNGLDTTLANLSGLSVKTIIDHTEKNLEIIVVEEIKKRYPEIYELLDNMKDEYILGNYIITHAGLSRYIDHAIEKDYWKVNNWANTEKFIDNFPFSEKYNRDKIYVFGHWHTRKLYKRFYNHEDHNDSIFRYINFIGLDATTNITNKVNVLILSEIEGGIIKEIRDEKF